MKNENIIRSQISEGEIFNVIDKYDLVVLPISPGGSLDSALEQKIKDHFKIKMYKPPVASNIIGEVNLFWFYGDSIPKPPYVAFYIYQDENTDSNYFNKVGFNIAKCLSLEFFLKKNHLEVAILLPIDRNKYDKDELSVLSNGVSEGIKKPCDLYYHFETNTNSDINKSNQYKVQDTPKKHSVFISYDHDSDGVHFRKIKELLPKYQITTFDYGLDVFSRKVNYKDLESKIENSLLFISLFSNYYSQNKSLLSEINLANKFKKPILIVKPDNKVIIPVDFQRNRIIVLGKENLEETIHEILENPGHIYNSINYWWLSVSIFDKDLFTGIYDNIMKQSHNKTFNKGDKVFIYFEPDKVLVSELEIKNLDYKNSLLPISEIESKRDFIPPIKISNELIKKNTSQEQPGAVTGECVLLEESFVNVLIKYINDEISKAKNIEIENFNIPGFNNDSIKEKKKDQLGITKDVQALARLIAYKDLHPPLSIALFGNWGSGKSFFMAQLQEEIKELSKKAKTADIPVCKGIVHIEFNAWHYMDANLWASLVFHIFDKLNIECGNKTAKEQQEIELYKNLASYEALKKEAEIIKDDAETNYNSLKTELEKLIQEKADKEKAFRLNFSDTIQIASDTITSNEELKSILSNIGITDLSKLTFGLSKKIVEELSSTFRVFVSAIKGSLKLKKNIWSVLIILAASGTICFLLIKYLSINSTWIRNIVTYGISSIALIGGWYERVIAPQIKKINSSVHSLEKINLEVEKRKDESLQILKSEIEKIELVLQSSSSLLKDKRRDFAEAEQNLTIIQSEIDRNKHSKLLAGFIQQRLESEDYKKQLGIVSMIREDFDSLSKLLLSEDSKLANKPFERIVLYIDDLDRCPADRVVQVLEALHLLLAFPLFVVIVGVDPRWVSNALKEKYPRFLNEGFSNADRDGLNQQNNNATTLDYLEKIFQLPILLKPVDVVGSKKLVESLLFDDILKEPIQTRTIEEQHNNKIDEDIAKPENQLFKNRDINTSKDKNRVDDRGKTIQHEIQQDQPTSMTEAERKMTTELYNKLKITQIEIDFIKSISTLIGETPRAVKRFINTYRLIRSHEDFSPIANNIDSLKSIIFFLALANNHKVGMRSLVNSWANDSNLLINPNLDLLSDDDKAIISQLELYKNRSFVLPVLRFSFYFES